jgi:hypothetical protein
MKVKWWEDIVPETTTVEDVLRVCEAIIDSQEQERCLSQVVHKMGILRRSMQRGLSTLIFKTENQTVLQALMEKCRGNRQDPVVAEIADALGSVYSNTDWSGEIEPAEQLALRIAFLNGGKRVDLHPNLPSTNEGAVDEAIQLYYKAHPRKKS